MAWTTPQGACVPLRGTRSSAVPVVGRAPALADLSRAGIRSWPAAAPPGDARAACPASLGARAGLAGARAARDSLHRPFEVRPDRPVFLARLDRHRGVLFRPGVPARQ